MVTLSVPLPLEELVLMQAFDVMYVSNACCWPLY